MSHRRLQYLLLALFCACTSQAWAALPAVALVEASSYTADVQSKLMATGKFSAVDIIDASTITPTVAQLQQYKSVLVFSDSPFADAVTLGNNLDTYVRGGGGVVTAVFANTDPGDLSIGGAFDSNGDSPITITDQSEGTELTLGTIHVPSSPLMAGVTSFDGGSSSYYGPGTLTTGAVDVADWSNGTPLVSYKNVDGHGHYVVNLNFYPPSSDIRADFWLSTTDGAALMANALLFGTVPPSAVPALDPWGMLALVSLLAAAAILVRKTRWDA